MESCHESPRIGDVWPRNLGAMASTIKKESLCRHFAPQSAARYPICLFASLVTKKMAEVSGVLLLTKKDDAPIGVDPT